jgi:pimeloyl-ACP methyl ester carboxylesterase
LVDASAGVGNFIEVAGASLYYEERGRGVPLVLLHGGLMSSEMWESLLPHLADFRVITPDTRGHGRSRNPGGAFDYETRADDVAALIAALGLVRPVVGGYSDGGELALRFAVRHRGVAGAVIVGGCAADFDDGWLRDAARRVLFIDAADVPDLARLEEDWGEGTAVVKSWHAGGEAHWRALVHQSAALWLSTTPLRREEVARVEEPVLVIAGDRDELTPLDQVAALYRALPNAELAVCPWAEHVAPLTPERAGVFGCVVRDFVARHAGHGGS